MTNDRKREIGHKILGLLRDEDIGERELWDILSILEDVQNSILRTLIGEHPASGTEAV